MQQQIPFKNKNDDNNRAFNNMKMIKLPAYEVLVCTEQDFPLNT